MVGGFLKENGIENTFIEGNVTRREQAIAAFKSAEIQVMMLSLEHAASGTLSNLKPSCTGCPSSQRHETGCLYLHDHEQALFHMPTHNLSCPLWF